MTRLTSGRTAPWLCASVALALVGVAAAPARAATEAALVRAARRPGTMWVDIRYDLVGAVEDTATVFITASSDGGASYDVPVVSVAGAIGRGVHTGPGHHAVWDAGADIPQLFDSPWEVAVHAGARWAQADSDMVHVPEGRFTMGSEDGDYHERPPHTVWLPGYWVDRFEVTNREYMHFVQATGHRTMAEEAGTSVVYRDGQYYTLPGVSWRAPNDRRSGLWRLLEHPVVHVGWPDASAYCAWAGKRLPSEAEWEKAARGPDARPYPWGAERPDEGGPRRANYGTNSCCNTSALDGYVDTAPVGSFPSGASPYGAQDMAGNAWEWTADWYGREYYGVSPARVPTGPDTGTERSLRGGSFVSPPHRLRTTFRGHHTEDTHHNYGGFRCARDEQ